MNDMNDIFSEIKKFGFGFMRLPKENDVIDVEQTKRMVDTFLAAGFNYFDTAWAYPGSEEALGEALVKRHPRDSFKLATKLAAWRANSKEEALGQFATSLEKTGTGYFDFYLLHNLGEHRTKYYDDYGAWDFVHQKKREGLIRHLGFSFHSTPEDLEGILQAHPEVDFVQLQINYADWHSPLIQSEGCYEVARRHGKPIIIMEPVKGGLLANPPASVRDILHAANPQYSPAAWALRFAASLDGVLAVLSGMSTLAQVEENVANMAGFTGMSQDELQVIAAAQAELDRFPIIPCTTCNYCAEVCPNDIGVSGTLMAMNNLTLYQNKDAALRDEHWLVTMHNRKRASECVQCGACEDVCPQHIHIREVLAKACKALDIA